MAHRISDLIKNDAISSGKIKKAIEINSIYDEDLRKDLSTLQKERKHFMQSLSKKKLDFIRKCKLPSIHQTCSATWPDNAAIQKKVAEFCLGSSSNFTTQRNAGSPAPLVRPRSQPSSNEMGKLNYRSRSIISEKDFALEESDTLHQEDDNRFPSADQGATNAIKARNDSGSTSFKIPSPGIGLPATRSSMLSRLSNSNDLAQSHSLPNSPTVPRRRAFTLDSSLGKSQGYDLKIALGRLQSTPATKQGRRCRTETCPVDLEDVGRLSPRAPTSPQISPRRLRAFQPLGADQSQRSPQEGLFLLPKLDTRGSLSSMLDDNGKERAKRRVLSLAADNTTREALDLQNLSPKTEKKLRNFLNSENGGLTGFSSKQDGLEDRVEDGKGPKRPEAEEEECTWNSDNDDDDDETIGNNVAGQKKIHSLEEIKHTRYLRMKSPVHWLPKMGNMPKPLLSSSIIVGHTKVGFKSISERQGDKEENKNSEQSKCYDEMENMEWKGIDEQSKLEPKEKENNNNNETYRDDPEVKENSFIGCY
ncbi:uncharacterized protein LOC111334596 isoform X2 [Stylophora pistillata]|uniref:uncharacterized protein LOC111334596 isoform X2 n=1 Tax=Stylophora pistillata TaxID=50429 RepID=UPI000C05206F|nr:uncharacterized protein LOC111334596 isoform X2 [Stylophora pistillata]